jgi:hypothetical protein
MTAKELLIDEIEKLPDDKIERIIDFIKSLKSLKEDYTPKNLDATQKKLLDLMKYTISSGRKDFAEKHDKYLYGIE